MKISLDALVKFKKELKKGQIITAYQGLMAYFRELRSYFEQHYPTYEVPGHIYQGFMDMTYFAVLPPSLKKRGLKVAIVFDYQSFRFEVWLSGRNRQIQVAASAEIREQGWNSYHLTPAPDQADSILDHILVADPNFSDLESLTREIEQGTLVFIREVEQFFSSLDD